MSDTNRLNKKEWVVKPISISTARQLVEAHHYTHSAGNTAVYTFGLFKIGEALMEAMCLGCSWWLPPTKVAAMATFQEGDWRRVLSLSRLVVTPHVPKNAASFLIAWSIKMIDKTAWHCLVTYADTYQGHLGGIYKATNWEYMGLTKPEAVFVKNGKMMGRKRGAITLTHTQMSERGFQKVGVSTKHKFRMIL